MRRTAATFAVLGALAALPAAALAQFPYRPQGAQTDYTQYYLPPSDPVPNDLVKKLVWMYASTPAPAGPGQPVNPLTLDKRELGGVRGAWVVDRDRSAPQAWATTTGRPDVTIAVLDSGIMWNRWDKPDGQVRVKIRLNAGELPMPQDDRATSTDPLVPDCAALASRVGHRDLNGDGVFNVLDYACDSRVDPDPANGVGSPDPNTHNAVLDPEDVIIAFSDGTDADHNGYTDDIAGWDFLDDDNDPFDDVQYGHGSGEIMDSGAEADNGDEQLGTCPNCMVLPLRVGTSFIAEVNRFALATMYATDNGVDVVQEALGTLNKSGLGLDSIKYAYDHGTTVIASAADEAAQHHNWPSSYPYAIVVNSVTHTEDTDPATPTSYLQFNGCTNFSSRITLAIPSVSCSSDATGRSAGMAGLVYSAALNAREQGKLSGNPDCHRVDGSECAITPNEVRQVMASGSWDGVQAADDVNFAQDPATGADTDQGCGGHPIPGCTDPFEPLTASAPRETAPTSYPARKGHDQFYGYGRVHMSRAVSEVEPKSGDSNIPPEVELTSPGWFDMVDPAKPNLSIDGHVWDRGRPYTCKVYVAPGAYPKDTTEPNGDFVELPSGICNGQTRTDPVDGAIASASVADIKALFSPNTGDFTGPEGGASGQTPNPTGNVGRPNDEPYAFVVKVVATTVDQSPEMTGTDRTQAYLHRDQDMIAGFPKLLPGDIEASPVLADLDGDNRNELIVANSDGVVHAWRRDGSELPGWPVHTDEIDAMHDGSPAVSSGAVNPAYGAILGTPAVGDLHHDGRLEVVVADMEDKAYVFDSDGNLEQRFHTNEAYSGKPLHPFENVRGVGPDGNFDPELANLHRMQHGFIASPALADLDGDGTLDIVAAALDRHVYAWHADGTAVAGWPVVVVDHSKLRDAKPQIDPATHRPFFDIPTKATGGEHHDQGAIVDTPALGDLTGDGRPEVVVGTNENYWQHEGNEGDLNAGGVNLALYQVLGGTLPLANGRLYAIKPEGDPDGNPNDDDGPWLKGWPFKVGILDAGLLPLVGEGMTGYPIIGSVPCQGSGPARRVGAMPAAGVAYVINANGESCYDRDPGGHDIALNTEGGAGTDQPMLAAVGSPAFGALAGGTAMLAPSAGVQRAADVVLPEYQGGQDYLNAWDLQQPQGTIKQGWPATMNDLQFLSGPSVADISPAPGEEVIGGSAHDDLQAFVSTGQKLAPNWPKLTGDWTVANPTIGSFGTIDTDPAAKLVVVAGTRNGRLSAYSTGAAACSPASWPKFHHDLANSGDLDRDATPPGVPMDAVVAGGNLSFEAPGDDLLCGTAKSYEVVTSDEPIGARNFAQASAVDGAPDPAAAGTAQSFALPAGVKRYVAIRAVDDQGNLGRPALVDRGEAPAAGPGENQTPGQGQTPPGGGKPATPGSPAGGHAVLADKHGCLPRRMGVKSRGLGTIRLGDDVKRTLRHVGRPHTKKGSVWTYCVRGRRGGKVALVFVKRHIRLIASTAPGHEAIGGAGPGDRIAKIHRTYPGSSRYGRGIFFTHRSSRIVFVVRRKRVRVVGVADRRAILKPGLLRAYLKAAHLQP